MNDFAELPAVEACGHWPALARNWQRMGSPLRPSPEDCTAYAHFAQAWIDGHGPPRVLLLGVTPEIYRLPWPAGHTFTAIDHTPDMIEHVWPGSSGDVLFADWLSFQLPPESRDLVFCDGGLHLLGYPAGQATLVSRLHQVLTPGGRCIFRLFVPPVERESPEAVLAALLSGDIKTVDLLKLRLGMALQVSPEKGVAVRTVWENLSRRVQEGRALGDLLDGKPENWQAIAAYRSSEACYHFVSIDQARELFCGAGQFSFCDQFTPAYPLGERCPLVVFEKC